MPIRYALLSATAYWLAAATYIVVSTSAAARGAESIESLKDTELFKGLMFVALSGLLFGGVSFGLFKRIERAVREQIEQQHVFLTAQRRALTGLLAASIAHDFRNVLSIAEFSLDPLEDVATDRDSRESLDALRTSLRDGAALANRLAQLGKDTAVESRRPVDLAQAARDVLRLLKGHPSLHDVDVTVDMAAPIRVDAYPVLIDQVLTNLILNAGSAAGKDGRVRIRARTDADRVVLEVEDDGAGIPPEMRERVFEPFVSGKKNGLGLGLLSARMCAEMHGGRVEIGDSDLGGAAVRVVFPTGDVAESDE